MDEIHFAPPKRPWHDDSPGLHQQTLWFQPWLQSDYGSLSSARLMKLLRRRRARSPGPNGSVKRGIALRSSVPKPPNTPPYPDEKKMVGFCRELSAFSTPRKTSLGDLYLELHPTRCPSGAKAGLVPTFPHRKEKRNDPKPPTHSFLSGNPPQKKGRSFHPLPSRPPGAKDFFPPARLRRREFPRAPRCKGLVSTDSEAKDSVRFDAPAQALGRIPKLFHSTQLPARKRTRFRFPSPGSKDRRIQGPRGVELPVLEVAEGLRQRGIDGALLTERLERPAGRAQGSIYSLQRLGV